MKRKKLIKYLLPLFFALFAILFYIVIHNPAFGSEDFTTALLVFCAALGSAAIVLFTGGAQRFVLRFYVGVSLVFPPLFLFVVKISKVNSPLHYIAFGLLVIGFIYLRLFVGAHRAQEGSGGVQEGSGGVQEGSEGAQEDSVLRRSSKRGLRRSSRGLRRSSRGLSG